MQRFGDNRSADRGDCGLFGTYRLLLAIAVIISHMGILVWGIQTGVAAVVCFFMVSGYAMTALIDNTYPNMPSQAAAFYGDRFLRLAPQYYFYLALCTFAVLVLGWRLSTMQSGPANLPSFAASLAIVPLVFWMYSDSINTFFLNPPTWSLGLEACFYLLLPWLLRSRATIWAAGLAGGVVWMLAVEGVLDPDFFAYRLLPGTFVFFLIGIAICRGDWWLYGTLIAFFVLNAAVLLAKDKIWLGYNLSLLIGSAVGCVAMPLLARLPRNRFDDWLGGASYGTYLVH
jgi:peptidoglycan/LPS O-acetylase OafA/YrhL